MEGNVAPLHSAQVMIPRKAGEEIVTTILPSEEPKDEQHEHATILVAKLITLLAETKQPAVVLTCNFGPITIESTHMDMPAQQIGPEGGVQEVCTNVPFRILGTKIWREPGVSNKHM